MVRVSLRKFLVMVLIVLLVMILALGYLYYVLSRPPGLETYRTSELQPLFSIYGKSSKAEDLLKRPNDVAFDEAGNIYVTDSENGRVFVFDGGGRFLRQIGKKGKGKGGLQVPMGIAVAKDGTTFITDKALNKIAIFDKKGVPKKDLLLPHPMKPFVIGNRLYVTTSEAIKVYSLAGRELTRFGRKGKARGEFVYPFGIAVDNDGRIYVADLVNLRVQAVKSDGEVIWVKGEPPKEIMGKDRTFGLPAGLALGQDGYLYLVDSFYHQITLLAKDGKIIGSVGREGSREGEFSYPAGIASRGDGVFAVADKYNDRVQVLRITIKEKIKKIKR
ncbi:MAG: 6-bladed beta-propeller [Actinobacteria bacterium]|nr:6-bladed beta-propeller [Actinomycetota bacterium]